MNKPTNRIEKPTLKVYVPLQNAYEHFNNTLFNGTLPNCLLTLRNAGKEYGYYAHERFGTQANDGHTDEIALNPVHFGRGVKEVLSTLVHEMCHLWQFHYGKPSRNGYHNKEWGDKMKEVGLHPSSTGQMGGKETGQRVSHYIMEGGAYEDAFNKLQDDALPTLLADVWVKAPKKSKPKTKYCCPSCDAAAWGKDGLLLRCGDCSVDMEPQE